jgi:diketogulonate reductase-like aldo/keto reductase
LLPYCQENDVMLISYRPLERGRLVKPGFRVLDKLAEKYGKTQAQVSLNWLISQEKVVAIPRSTKVEHLKDNMEAIGWRTSDNEYRQLEESFR